jgi:hypothetical protein
MKGLKYILILILAGSSGFAQTANDILNSTVAAMGGLEKWKSIDYIQMKHAGHKHWLEQSENPNGPFITSYEVVDETRSVWKDQLSRKETTNQFQSSSASQSEIMINGEKGIMKFGDRSFPMPAAYRTNYNQWVRYAPERLIFDGQNFLLTKEKDEVVEGTKHWVISYVKNELKHTLYINAITHLLYKAEIDTFSPEDVFNYPWGKFKTTIIYSLQWLYAGNMRYPAQWDVFKLGKPYLSITILDIDFKPEVDPSLFEISADIPSPSPLNLVENSPLKTEGLIEVANGIRTIPGPWYVAHVEQSDGILVIESPISSGYSERHIAFLKEKYPNKPIKAVFVTSDAWPHVGGVRGYAAHKIPIYTHRLNEELLKKVLAADHSPLPDAYEKSRSKPQFKLIDKTLELKDKDNPVRIIPVDGEGGERMIVLYFPLQKVLYTSDLVQYSERSKSFFSPQYLSEVKAVVDKHHLEVETVFAFHTSPLPYSEMLDFLNSTIK